VLIIRRSDMYYIWYLVSSHRNFTLNPNITYIRQQLTSLVSLLYFRTGIVTTFRPRFTHNKQNNNQLFTFPYTTPEWQVWCMGKWTADYYFVCLCVNRDLNVVTIPVRKYRGDTSEVSCCLKNVVFGFNVMFWCDDTRCCIIQVWPPDDEHTVLETCRGI